MSHGPRRALLVIDVQNEYISGNLKIEYPPLDVSLANIARAMEAAHAANIPVIVVQHLSRPGAALFARDSDAAALHISVSERHYDLLVEKQLASALSGTPLAAWLRERQIDTLSVVGYMTHNCDDSTVRQAKHEGWSVELLHDATGAPSYRNACGAASAEEIHRVFCIVMHTGFAAVTSTDRWIEAVRQGEALQADSIDASHRRALGEDIPLVAN